MARSLPTGIRRDRLGYRVRVRVAQGDGGLKTRRFPITTSLKEMTQWREDQRVEYRKYSRLATAPLPATPGTFADDVARYLASVRSMPTYTDRVREISAWLPIFGPRRRATITPAEIRAQMAEWARTKAASTVNHRRKALAHLWRVLDGTTRPNPVREVPNLREPDPEPRGVSFAVIECILEAMPDRGQGLRGTKRALESKSKARLLVIAATGITPKTLGRIEPRHVDFARGLVFVPGREKGRGSRGRTVPLSARGVAAFRAMDAADAWGPFSHHSLRQAFRRACARVCDDGALDGLRVYDLRHSFATAVYAASGDIRATQLLIGHADPRMTHRYTLAAVDTRTSAAITALDAMLGGRGSAA